MNAAYATGTVALDLWQGVADTINRRTSRRDGRSGLRAELRRQARGTLTAAGIPHGPPSVWRFEMDERRQQLTFVVFVGPDRVVAGDKVRNLRRSPWLSLSSPCAVCDLPGMRVLGPPPPLTVLSADSDPTPPVFDRIDSACPRHSRLVRMRLAYRFDPRMKG